MALYTGNIKFTATDTEPTSDKGRLYYDDSESQLKHYNGSAWEKVNKNALVDTAFTTTNSAGAETAYVQSYTIPSNAGTMAVKLWGAGGNVQYGASYGGPGGYAYIEISAAANTVLYIGVGTAGGTTYGAGGGGFSWIGTSSSYSTSNIIAIAGGGGGAHTGVLMSMLVLVVEVVVGPLLIVIVGEELKMLGVQQVLVL